MQLNHYNKDILRLTTAGNVDDGKSTLIGRLLFDSKSLMDDQLINLKEISSNENVQELNLALLTDGLRAEREQGITIDVAYRYFETTNRKFIIADTPGHIQYTRNMVTGAGTSNLAIILIDARNGVVEQTKRHALIASLLGIPHLAVCINKMDLVDYSNDVFKQIANDFKSFASKLLIKDVQFFPISALKGDNVVNKSSNMNWFAGTTLLFHLENVHIGADINQIDLRFPIQYVIRPRDDKFHDFRAFSGRLSSGKIKVGEEIVALPSGFKSKVKSIYVGDEKVSEAAAPLSISIEIFEDIDISRGDMIVRPGNLTLQSQDITAMICWMDIVPLTLNKRYVVKHTTQETRCMIKEIVYKLNISTLSRVQNVSQLHLNEIGKVKFRTTNSLMYDSYTLNRETGSFIIIDESTNVTVGACMIID